MLRRVCLLVSILISPGLLSTAFAETDKDVASALKQATGGAFNVLDYVTVDLNKDGQQDWVGILKMDRATDPTTRIYVLLRKGSRLKVSAMSREVSYIDCAGTCGTEIVSAKEGGVFIAKYNKGGWGTAAATTQFALRGNRWQAISEKRHSVDAQLDRAETTETNLLTGEYRSAVVFGGMSGESKPARVKRGVKNKRTPLWLEAFDPVYF